jgi:hypothetical protein
MITFNDKKTLTYVIMKGFNKDEITILSKSVDKIVIFDDSEDEDIRKSFESLFKELGNKITLYEGQIDTNLESYFKLHQDEKINYIFKGDFNITKNF